MDILNHIFTSGITPTNKIYFNLQAKLPFNNTTFAIRFCKLGAYHAGRILLTQLGSNSTIRLQKDGDSNIWVTNMRERIIWKILIK